MLNDFVTRTPNLESKKDQKTCRSVCVRRPVGLFLSPGEHGSPPRPSDSLGGDDKYKHGAVPDLRFTRVPTSVPAPLSSEDSYSWMTVLMSALRRPPCSLPGACSLRSGPPCVQAHLQLNLYAQIPFLRTSPFFKAIHRLMGNFKTTEKQK